MRSEEQIKSEWSRLDNDDVNLVCNILREHEVRIEDYLVDFVSSLCNIEKSRMMTSTADISAIHSRWFYWYAYRYMTNDTFARIADKTERFGRKYTMAAVQHGVLKMGSMVASESVWVKRWVLIKRIIKLRDISGNNAILDDNASVVISHPKNVKVKLNVIND